MMLNKTNRVKKYEIGGVLINESENCDLDSILNRIKISNDGNLIATASIPCELPYENQEYYSNCDDYGEDDEYDYIDPSDYYYEQQSFYEEGPHKFLALKIWENGTFKSVKEFYNMNIIDMEFSNDSSLFAIAFENKDDCGGDCCSKVNHIDIMSIYELYEEYNFRTNLSIRLKEHELCLGIAISNNSRYIAIRIYDKNIHMNIVRLIDISTGMQVSQIDLKKYKLEYKSEYISDIMKFTYDDSFLVLTLDEDSDRFTSPLTILDIKDKKQVYYDNRIPHKSIDIGNVSNKIIYYKRSDGYEKASYKILDLEKMEINKISEEDDFFAYFLNTYSKFTLDDSRVLISGCYLKQNEETEISDCEDNISLFECEKLKCIKTINISKLVRCKTKNIERIDINKYDEFLIYHNNYKKYYISCIDGISLKTIFIKEYPYKMKQVGADIYTCDYNSHTETCALVNNYYYEDSINCTLVFSTQERALDDIFNIHIQYK